MRTLWDDPALAQEMGKRAEARYWQLFTAEQMARSYTRPVPRAGVEALLRRSTPGADSSQLQVADLKLDLRTLRVTRGSKVITLQPREYRLLEYLMRNVNQVVTRTMLLESVWDYHFDPQTNVIDVQISRLRAKVDKDFPVMLIHTLRGVGYRMGAAPPDDGTERTLA
jgi:two-component system OmpR family response regulator